MIYLQNVSKEFLDKKKKKSNKVLKDIHLEINDQDIFGIIGYSGAGKSTLLKCINGLVFPTHGRVVVGDKDLSTLSATEILGLRNKIGMVFQDFRLLWSRTVRENIAFPLEIAGKKQSKILDRVNYLLEKVHLVEKADAYPAELSGGQKQRVGIARALANEPDILLCDEATSALDPETTLSILQLLKEIHQESNLTIVLITHEIEVVKTICHKVAIMDQGEIIETGEVHQVLNFPTSVIAKQFLHQSPTPR